jgi:hypothetical protein
MGRYVGRTHPVDTTCAYGTNSRGIQANDSFCFFLGVTLTCCISLLSVFGLELRAGLTHLPVGKSGLPPAPVTEPNELYYSSRYEISTGFPERVETKEPIMREFSFGER